MTGAITILLAGGVGSRLNILVRLRAKPAVPFGGIYRIIDFTMSNIANSDIKKVAVLTQYKPLSLMDHISDGSHWDLSGRTRSVKILPPKTGEKDWDWYRGTADAVRQNIDFILSEKKVRDVLVLSGDHVYSMDYSPLVEFHRLRHAKVTIGMLEVPWEETSSYGIGITDSEDRIIDWEEKPLKARSNFASMGIYVFDKDYLVTMLRSTKDPDFGHHIIPKAMREGTVFAYRFAGYWKDVGTIQAYLDANMDLLSPDSRLKPEIWKTKTNPSSKELSSDFPPVHITSRGSVTNSAISPGCVINGTVERSILSPGVIVEEGALVKDSVIFHNTVIKKGASIDRCIIDKHVSIGKNAMVGIGNPGTANIDFPDHLNSGITLVGKSAVILDGSRIGTNCIIYPLISTRGLGHSPLPDGSSMGNI